MPAHVRRDAEQGWYHGGVFSAKDFDSGHDGMDLEAFLQHRYSQVAQLEKEHQRTASCGHRPTPFRMTVYYLSEASRKLRAVAAELDPSSFTKVVWLWRGMRDMKISERFMDTGGSELAPMSTSHTQQTAVRYAESTCPLIFKYRTRGLSRGCSIKYLSAYPNEDEYLYPPLTYLLPESID
eukprot:1325714-Prymnesium_polylepis.1